MASAFEGDRRGGDAYRRPEGLQEIATSGWFW
jgi:hypothetical protein